MGKLKKIQNFVQKKLSQKLYNKLQNCIHFMNIDVKYNKNCQM